MITDIFLRYKRLAEEHFISILDDNQDRDLCPVSTEDILQTVLTDIKEKMKKDLDLEDDDKDLQEELLTLEEAEDLVREHNSDQGLYDVKLQDIGMREADFL